MTRRTLTHTLLTSSSYGTMLWYVAQDPESNNEGV